MGRWRGALASAAWGLCVCAAVLSLAHRASGATCQVDLSNTVTVFPTQNLNCTAYNSFVLTANNFVIWSLKDNVTNIVSIVVGAPLVSSQWAGLGFSATGAMPGSTAMIATLNLAGLPKVTEYSLNNRIASDVVPGSTNLYLVGNVQGVYEKSTDTVYMAFQVNFNKSLASPNFLLMAYGQASADGTQLSYHGFDSRVAVPSQFATGDLGQPVRITIGQQAKIHGVLQVFGLGVLLPIGTMIARYARGFDPAWFYVHIGIQIFGFTIIIGGVAVGIDLARKIQPVGFAAHRGLGFFILVLVILQVLAVVLRPKKEAKLRKYWNWYHGWAGRLVLFLAVINIFYGIHIANGENKLKVGYGVMLALELVAFAILETLLWLRWNRQPNVQASTSDGFQFGGST